MPDKKELLEIIKTYLPKYLSLELKEDLFKKIEENFPYSDNPDILYLKLNNTQCLYQGDGMIDIPFPKLNIEKGCYEMEYFDGALLSNTCDLITEYNRLENNNALYSVILPLDKYIAKLESKGISQDRIRNFKNELKKNRISNLFYLPELKCNEELIIGESFIRFDYCTSLTSDFMNSDRYDYNYKTQGDRLFSFSNYGFYLFVFKLSVHFCRFREGVFRNNNESVYVKNKISGWRRIFLRLAHHFT